MLGSETGSIKRKVCIAEVGEVVLSTNSFTIIPSKYKDDRSSRPFVRFIVYEAKKEGVDRRGEKRKIFIHDHRANTLKAAQYQNFLKRARWGSKTHGAPQAMSLAEAVRLPARVNVMEMNVRGDTFTYINLFESEDKKASALLSVLPDLLVEERLSLDRITKHDPLWAWGGRKSSAFGPTEDTLPVVALTNGNKKIVLSCRKSRDVVTLSSRIERVSLL